MEYIIFYVLAFIFGTAIGSFLNVCIFRIPDKENIVSKRSHCLSCGNVLEWYELVPIASYLIQKGKCRHCGAGISVQYPLIELSGGLAFVWIAAVHGAAIYGFICCLCVSALIVISIIDWRTREIPAGCNLFIGVLGIFHIFTDLAHWYDYVLGFFLVSGIFFIIYRITRGKGIGGGDIKLMAAAGLLLGWQGILLALVIGSVSGSVIHIALMKFRKLGRELAFGPYLSLGIFIAMLYGNIIIKWYANFYL